MTSLLKSSPLPAAILFICAVLTAPLVLAGAHTILRSGNGNQFTVPFGAQVLGSTTMLSLDFTADTYTTSRVERTTTVGEASFVSGDASEFSLVNNCAGQTLAAGSAETCTIDITFAPTREGAAEAIVFINATGGQSRDIRVTGAAGRIDQAADSDTVGLVNAQTRLNRRLARAQIRAVTERLEGLNNASLNNGEDISGVWASGKVGVGNKDATAASDQIEFDNDTITLGFDAHLNDNFSMGAAVGYGAGAALVGTGGTESEASGYSAMLYGNYLMDNQLFFNGMLGYGSIDHKMRRNIELLSLNAVATRDSSQEFGAFTAGYQFARPGLDLSPYLRYSYTQDDFDAVTESGAMGNNLVYQDVSVSASRYAAGLLATTLRPIDAGWVKTWVRLEYSRDSADDDPASVYYADDVSQALYLLPTIDYDNTALLVGVGSDFLLANGLDVGFSYNATQYFNAEFDHDLRLRLSKPLGAGSESAARSQSFVGNPFTIPLNMQFGAGAADNVNRALNVEDKLSDDIYFLTFSTDKDFALSDNARFVLQAMVDQEKHRRFAKLTRNRVGLKGQFEYRTSGAFDALTFALTGAANYDDYGSDFRSGSNTMVGLSAQQAFTSRIHWYAQLSTHERDAENTVFDLEFDAVKVTVDYAMGDKGALYVTGEYRDGDTVSSNFGDAIVPDIPSVADDAFITTHTASRYEAETTIWTLGYNLPLGAKDSIDFSWRRATSTPGLEPLEGYYDGSDYVAEMWSIFYLVRF